MKIKVKKLREDAILPEYQTSGAAGFDLHAIEDITIMPGETKLIKCGLSMEIPEGYELQIRPRSGLSAKTTLRIANSPGTVDSDYRGEIGVIAHNQVVGESHRDVLTFRSYKQGKPENPIITKEPNPQFILNFKKGERVAQGVVVPVIRAEFELVNELSNTERGSGAFGSTGK